jgi:hypothetical protein
VQEPYGTLNSANLTAVDQSFLTPPTPASNKLGSCCSPMLARREMAPPMSKINATAVPANNTNGLDEKQCSKVRSIVRSSRGIFPHPLISFLSHFSPTHV